MGKQISDILRTERRAKAIDMRRVGITWERIATECGYSSAAAAAADIYKVLSDRTREMGEAVTGLRSIEADKLDAMERVIIRIMNKPHVLAQQGRIVYNQDGTPVEDTAPLFQCVDRLLRIAERRAKLLGLDAPVKAQVEIKNTGVDSAIAEYLAGMVTGGKETTPRHPEIRELENGSTP